MAQNWLTIPYEELLGRVDAVVQELRQRGICLMRSGSVRGGGRGTFRFDENRLRYLAHECQTKYYARCEGSPFYPCLASQMAHEDVECYNSEERPWIPSLARPQRGEFIMAMMLNGYVSDFSESGTECVFRVGYQGILHNMINAHRKSEFGSETAARFKRAFPRQSMKRAREAPRRVIPSMNVLIVG